MANDETTETLRARAERWLILAETPYGQFGGWEGMEAIPIRLVTALLATLSRVEAEQVEAITDAHGLGQESTIRDVNAGLLDDMITPRLEAERIMGAQEREHADKARAFAEQKQSDAEHSRDGWRHDAEAEKQRADAAEALVQAGEKRIADLCDAYEEQFIAREAAEALVETRTQSEQLALRRLSDALTGGNAATWDEVFHTAESAERDQTRRQDFEARCQQLEAFLAHAKRDHSLPGICCPEV